MLTKLTRGTSGGLKDLIGEIVAGKKGEEGVAEDGKRREVQSDPPERDHGLW